MKKEKKRKKNNLQFILIKLKLQYLQIQIEDTQGKAHIYTNRIYLRLHACTNNSNKISQRSSIPTCKRTKD